MPDDAADIRATRAQLCCTRNGSGPSGTPAPHVVLKIRRRKFNPRSSKAGEIVVTRRLFRSGESEYLLNGKLCRLRDIQDIFMGTGLGPESYAIIEQGRIGQILSSKPTDRRAIIEEAAGITKFKTKKRLAEARLEDAKLNLARINDIFDEVTRQMNSLKRQASQGRALRQACATKCAPSCAWCWPASSPQLDTERPALEAQLKAAWRRNRNVGRSRAALESEHGSARSAATPSRAKSRENRERLSQLAMEIDRAMAPASTNEERCAELDARSARRTSRIGAGTQRNWRALEAELRTNRQILRIRRRRRGRSAARMAQRQAGSAAPQPRAL